MSGAVTAWEVVYGRHKPTKVHKVFTNDGVILLKGGQWILYDVETKEEVGRSVDSKKVIKEGAYLVASGSSGAFECELIEPFYGSIMGFHIEDTGNIVNTSNDTQDRKPILPKVTSRFVTPPSVAQPFKSPLLETKPQVVKREPDDSQDSLATHTTVVQEDEEAFAADDHKRSPSTTIAIKANPKSVVKSPPKKKIKTKCDIFDDDD